MAGFLISYISYCFVKHCLANKPALQYIFALEENINNRGTQEDMVKLKTQNLINWSGMKKSDSLFKAPQRSTQCNWVGSWGNPWARCLFYSSSLLAELSLTTAVRQQSALHWAWAWSAGVHPHCKCAQPVILHSDQSCLSLLLCSHKQKLAQNVPQVEAFADRKSVV